MSNISYLEKEENAKSTTFYKGNVRLGNSSLGIKHPEQFVQVLDICSTLSTYEITILTELIRQSSLLGR